MRPHTASLLTVATCAAVAVGCGQTTTNASRRRPAESAPELSEEAARRAEENFGAAGGQVESAEHRRTEATHESDRQFGDLERLDAAAGRLVAPSGGNSVVWFAAIGQALSEANDVAAAGQPRIGLQGLGGRMWPLAVATSVRLQRASLWHPRD